MKKELPDDLNLVARWAKKMPFQKWQDAVIKVTFDDCVKDWFYSEYGERSGYDRHRSAKLFYDDIRSDKWELYEDLA